MPYSRASQVRSNGGPQSVMKRVQGLPEDLQAFLLGTCREDGTTADEARERMPGVDFAAGMTGLTTAEIPVSRTLPEGEELRYRYPAAVAEAVTDLPADLDRTAYPHQSSAAEDRNAQHWARWEAEMVDDRAAGAFLRREGVRLARLGHHQRLITAVADRPVSGTRLIRAVAALLDNAPHAALAHLSAPEPDPDEPALDRALEAALRVQCGTITGTEIAQRWQEALGDHPRTGVPETDAYLSVQAGVVQLLAGRPEEAESLLLQALTLAEMGDDPRLHLQATTILSTVAGYSGNNELMTSRAVSALNFAADHGLLGEPLAAQVAATSAMGRVLIGENPEPDSLEIGVLRTVTAMDWDGLTGVRKAGPYTTVLYLLVRARVGERPTSAQAVELARSIEHLIRVDRAGSALRVLPSVIAVLLTARRILTASDVVGHAARHYGEKPEVSIAAVMIDLADDRIDAATRRLDAMDRDESAMIRLTRVRLWLLRAILAHRVGVAAQIWPAMARALELAEYESLIMPFMDHAADVSAILSAPPAESEPSREFIDRILESIAGGGRAAGPRLTPAEQVVLEQLATGLSRRAAAEALGVSINTVRTHVRHIYRKLSAGSRAEALEVARARGLIDGL